MLDKLNDAAARAAAGASASLAVARARKGVPAAAAAAVGGMLVGCPAAWAKGDGGASSGGSGNAITQVFDKIQDQALIPFYQGLLGIIGLIALIFLIKELIQGATSSAGMQRTSHVTQCVVILVICIVMGFAPTIINWVLSFGDYGGSVDVSKLKG